MYLEDNTVELLKSELIGAVACSDSEKFGLAEKSAYIVPVSYTHLDVYKRQDLEQVNILHEYNTTQSDIVRKYKCF